ncbi:hypothetical protein DFH07DRAFT_1027678 [Mycena maculata]|uniref:Uncharacterized protein n=1 Tax=Mycena maculata TaxID=230809 RepID=A0AAD7J393_9AGAR|nr:hypothetical protein DFH07DRAFT_1027678 [Mycena maculata]
MEIHEGRQGKEPESNDDDVTRLGTSREKSGIGSIREKIEPAGSVSHVVFNEANTQLIASVKGVPPTPGILAVWDIAADGSLSENFTTVQPSTGGLLPFSMTVIPGKNAILAADAGDGVDVFDFNNAAGAGVAAGNSSTLPIKGQGATPFSPQTGNFYVNDIETAEITEINVDHNLKPSIVAMLRCVRQQYPQGNGTATIDNDIATVNQKDFMYVLAANATEVKVLSLNAPGKATALQTLSLAPVRVAGVPISPDNIRQLFFRPFRAR